MPENIVAGEEPRQVAEFLAKYAGSKAKTEAPRRRHASEGGG